MKTKNLKELQKFEKILEKNERKINLKTSILMITWTPLEANKKKEQALEQ